jgi:hypothetical protein
VRKFYYMLFGPYGWLYPSPIYQDEPEYTLAADE